MKHSSVTVEIFHQAGMAAANAVNVKQRELVNCNAFQGSTFNHRNNPELINDQEQPAQIRPLRYL